MISKQSKLWMILQLEVTSCLINASEIHKVVTDA